MNARDGLDVLRPALVARHGIIAIDSFEEERVERTLDTVARSRFSRPVPLFTWSATRGLRGPDGPVADAVSPLRALAAVDAIREGVFLFRDLHRHFDDARVVRTLRELRRRLTGSARIVFLLGPRLRLPVELRRDVVVVDFPLPGSSELGGLVDKHLGRITVDDETRTHLVAALRGLTANEATHALHLALHGQQTVDEAVLATLHDQKAQLARQDGVLEYVPQRWTLDDIGGLATLKDWFGRRQHLFERQDALERGLAPRGVLVMGIPGCGKSLTIKAIAALWNLPLFRLDMGRVFGGLYGSPEESFRRALTMMEQVAPAILWVDEIENGISAADSSGPDAGIKGRIFATFLTWMQEKPAQVFVGATANRIDLLPAELLRKGRFDQVFFIDLPEESERSEIFAVHLRRKGEDRGRFDTVTLAKATKGWNGAEIEAAVTAAIVDALAEDRVVEEDDIFMQVGKMVPLSRTMSEQIKGIRSWAHQRAIRAN